ncbi:hypothetical protein LKM00_26470 [Bacillus wiedmannii]|uniref:hypothetical protein n=1 Tax=Bacillus wiedmannii TaxID=1890302 RepID=UPI001E3157CB|nr:hypothetical protein [Bacillus wiedmannii]MCC2380945.1 hypothetical protein [Bacillus wiedmannii]MCC2425359.1 hypothetical protein [Bacillus wiedmannii]
MFDLTKEHYDLFIQVHNKHMSVFGTNNKQKYALEHVKNVVWDENEDCLKVHYDDVWWHYSKDLTWY